MKLVKPSDALKKSKRVGRGHGSGLGTTAGRGHKGAGQRSGHKYRFWFEGGQMPLHRRVPMRGFNNHNFAKTFEIVNLSQISKLKAKISMLKYCQKMVSFLLVLFLLRF